MLGGEGDEDEEVPNVVEREEEVERDGEEREQQEDAEEEEAREGDRPPTYQDAFFFPVLIVHGEESCHSGEDISWRAPIKKRIDVAGKKRRLEKSWPNRMWIELHSPWSLLPTQTNFREYTIGMN